MVETVKLQATTISGTFVAESAIITDHRGEFGRLFCARELEPALNQRRIVQINHSRTLTPGTVRGLHFQHPPHAEMKLVRCLRGRIWDVAVDLRANSPTFLKWHAEVLTPSNGRMLIIPEGCAHGFQVLEADSQVLYLHTAMYTPQSERGVPHDDPLLAITWPLPVTDLSERDRGHARIAADFRGISL
jgi:dTDP-4-dehydrorhamnose 3,5-epimerase